MLGWTGFDVWHAGVAAGGQRDREDDLGGGAGCVSDGWGGGITPGRDCRVSIERRSMWEIKLR